MAHHVFRSKPTAEIIHDQQRHARARVAFQTRRFPVFFNNVRIALDRCHDCSLCSKLPSRWQQWQPNSVLLDRDNRIAVAKTKPRQMSVLNHG
jgi:hypothetical protein